MNDKLQQEVHSIVMEMRPPNGAIGMLTATEVEQIIHSAATKGVMAGWCAGERTARNYWSKEMSALKDRIKQLEIENSFSKQ